MIWRCINYIVVRSTVRLHNEGEKVKWSLNQLIYTYPLCCRNEKSELLFGYVEKG